MATNTALVKVLADNADLTRKLAASEKKLKGFERAAQRTSKNTSGAFKSMMGPLSTVMGIAGIGGVTVAFQSMVREAGDSQRVAAQTAAVLRSTGGAAQITAGHLSTLSSTLSQQIAVDDEVVQSAGNVLLTFTGIRNELGKGNNIFDQTLGLTADMSRAFGTDMNKAAIQLGKALNDPVKGVSALARVGVTFTKGQKAQIKSLVESGDLLGAQKVVLSELRKEIGGSAAAYGKTLPGSVEKLKIAWGNFLASVGTVLAPVMQRVADAMSRIGGVSPGVQKTFLALAAFVALGIGLSKVVTAVRAFYSAFKLLTAVPKIFLAIRQAFFLLKLAMLSNPFLLVAAVAITAGILIVTHWRQVKGFLIGAWNMIKAAFWSVAHAVQNAARQGFLGPAGWIITHFTQVVGFFSGLPGRLGGYARAAGNAIRNGIMGAINGIGGLVSGALSGIAGVIRGVINPVIDGINTLIDGYNAIPGHGDIGHIPHMAMGGVVNRPTLALIGEAGPEAVVPLSRPQRARQVMREAGLTGGSGVTNYFTINTTGTVDEIALARSIGWQLAARGITA